MKVDDGSGRLPVTFFSLLRTALVRYFREHAKVHFAKIKILSLEAIL